MADGRGMTLKNYNVLKREVLTPIDETNRINVNKYGESGSYLFYLVSFIKLKGF